MRRIFAPLLFLAVVLLTLVPVLPAAGQAGSGVVIRLVRQSVWNGPDRPLFVQIRVTNGGQSPLTELNVVLSVQAPARARSVFQLSLQQDATPDLKSDPFPQAGAIAPGASRDFALLEPVPFLNENGLYPLRIQVLSQNVAVATLRTPMVFLAEHSESPLHLVWTWVLFERLQYGPDGVFTPGPLEADVAPGGRLDTLVTAMDSATPAAIDVVVSPVLTDQLVRMSDGYRIRGADGAVRTVPKGTGGAADAARLLEALRKIAGRPRTELVAQPFGDSRIPSLFRAGLGADLVRLVDRGRKVVGTTLGAEPSTQVFRPPLSQIDAGSAGLLGGMGAGILVLDDRSVRVAPALFPNPPPVVEIAGAGHSATALVQDQELAAVTADASSDAQLAAHVALGQLASVWLEFPGNPGRGVAALFSSDSTLPRRFFSAFVDLVRGSPWLRPTTASAMVSLAKPGGQAPLATASFAGLDPVLVQRLNEARRTESLFASTTGDADPIIPRLSESLLLAEGGSSIDSPSTGFEFVDWVERQIHGAYRRILPPDSRQPVTLASQHVSIPLSLRNDNPFPLTVDVRLVADRRIVFPKGNVVRLTLAPRQTTQFFVDIRAQTTGRFPIKFQVLPPRPCGNCLISESEVIVRATAYNRVALLVTIGAALFLMAWWGRRFLPRRKAKGPTAPAPAIQA